MKLVTFSYTEAPGEDTEWVLEKVLFAQVNLLVGRNSTGKSRTINTISGLARLISAARKEIYCSGKYKVSFEQGDEKWDYSLHFDNFQVLEEDLLYRGENVLHRGHGNIGRIRADAIEDNDGANERALKIRFQADARQVAVLTKRDAIQHPFLEGLHKWAASVRHFEFGWAMVPHNLAIAIKGAQIEVDERNTASVIPIFDKAVKHFGDAFKKTVISDMKRLGYSIDELDIRRPANAVVQEVLNGELVGISVKETELKCRTDQTSMSQGMFRTLSLIIQATYFSMTNEGGCMLVDDVGEGLDYERSCTLIDVLREKAKTSSLQLIMSTNNRFVMNRVPLDEWCVLQRTGSTVRVRNYANSRAAFERFKITGLNNFDLLATDYLEAVKVNE